MDNVYSRLKLINCQYFKGILFKCKGLLDFGKRMIIIGCYGPGLGVGLGYYVNELQRPLNS
jgi:hypothetical protein